MTYPSPVDPDSPAIAIAPRWRASYRQFGRGYRCRCHPYQLSPIIRMTVEWRQAFCVRRADRWALDSDDAGRAGGWGSPLPRPP